MNHSLYTHLQSRCGYLLMHRTWILQKEFVKFMYSDEVVDICLNNKTTDKESGKESDTPVVVPVKGAADKLPDGVTKTVMQQQQQMTL